VCCHVKRQDEALLFDNGGVAKGNASSGDERHDGSGCGLVDWVRLALETRILLQDACWSVTTRKKEQGEAESRRRQWLDA
jgi:hypothetical protein